METVLKPVAHIFTEEQLAEVCVEWQRILRLLDWQVYLAVVRTSQMDDPEDAGECSWSEPLKIAKIKVLDPQDWSPDFVVGHDMERTLVHELLHLYMIGWEAEPGTVQEAQQEQAICLLADALVGLRRATKGARPNGGQDVCAAP